MANEKLWPGDLYDLMAKGQIEYRIYPSLLDKYQTLLDYESEAEKPWNIVSEKAVKENRYPDKELGDYILSPEDIYDKTEKELIDMINRVPHDPIEAADRGTAMNEVIDCMITNKPCSRNDMTIQSIKHPDGSTISIQVDFNGFTFCFNPDLCRQIRDLLMGSICQYQIQAPIMTKHGGVWLYGYMDYWRAGEIIDLKTTGSYQFGNYQNKWQRHVYPWCAIESGLTDKVNQFVFLVAQLSKGAVINGKIYPEIYTYNHQQSENLIKTHLESFIDWLESHRELITDKKIFNQIS